MDATRLLELVKSCSITPGEFLKELSKLSAGHTRQAEQYRTSTNPTLRVFRTRTLENATRLKKVSELSYPPLNKARLNRANREGVQVFYASAGLPTTLAESEVKAGQFIIASRWEVLEPMLVQTVGFDETSNDIEKLYHEVFTAEARSYIPIAPLWRST